MKPFSFSFDRVYFTIATSFICNFDSLFLIVISFSKFQGMDAQGSKTCLTCAKAKIKCDKNFPKCGRCTRLGIECSAQLRGRGRPPNSVRQAEQAASMPTYNAHSHFTHQASGAQIHRSSAPPMRPTYMLVESVKAAMCEAPSGDKEAARIKYNAVTKWLLSVACCTGIEAFHGDIAALAKVCCFLKCFLIVFRCFSSCSCE